MKDPRMNTPRIAVIIVSWNVKALVAQCIESIKSNPGLGDNFEIVVVDNDSADGTVDHLRRHYPDVRVIANKKNVGFGAASNQAVAMSSADILVLANPDTELVGDFRRLLFHLSRPEIGAVFGKLVYPNGAVQVFLRNFPTPWNQLAEVLGLPRLVPDCVRAGEMIRSPRAYEREGYIDAASGAFFAIKKEAFVRAGMFDERFFIYGEDTDLFFRLGKSGYRIYYDPSVHILHHHGASTSQNRFMHARLQESRYRFVLKHYAPLTASLYRYGILFLYDLVRMVNLTAHSLFLRGKERRHCISRIRRHLAAAAWAVLGRLPDEKRD